MKGHHNVRATEALSDEAAEWFIRLRDDNLGIGQRERNVQWLKQSPTHIAELLRIQQVYKALRAANLQSRPPAPPGEASLNVIEFVPHSSSPRPTAPNKSPARLESWKVAASAAFVMVSLLLGFIVKVAWLDRSIETELGEWRTATLTDGTHVRLGPGSLLRVAFGDDHRSVKLVRGEAKFDVAKDHSRPFFVTSEMIRVLAVGTEFRVSRRGGEDEVAVTEGTVAVYPDSHQPFRGKIPQSMAQVATVEGTMALTAGEQVSISGSKPPVKREVNFDYEKSWSDGWLTYQDKTFAQVANEFNRRNRIKIVINDPSIAGRRLAFFRGKATDPESFVAALGASADIAIVRIAPNVLRVEFKRPIDAQSEQQSAAPKQSGAI